MHISKYVTACLLGHRYINFGALCMNFLEVSEDYAELTDPDHADEYNAPISAIQTLMTILTFGLLLSIGGVGIKKAFVTIRSANLSDLRARAINLSSFMRSRSRSNLNATDAPRLDGVEVDADEKRLGVLNPMRSSKEEARHTVEMTRVRSNKAMLGNKQLSAETSKTMALPSPTTAAAPFALTSVDLPAGWTALNTPAGKPYYYNSTTGTTSWQLPEE